MPNYVKVTQNQQEAVRKVTDPKLRVTQTQQEVVHTKTDPVLRVTQTRPEVVVTKTNPWFHVTNYMAEVIHAKTDPGVRFSQVVYEVVYATPATPVIPPVVPDPITPVEDARISQTVLGGVHTGLPYTRMSRASRIEVAYENPTTKVSQVAKEAVAYENPQANVSQVTLTGFAQEYPSTRVSQVTLSIVYRETPPAPPAVCTGVSAVIDDTSKIVTGTGQGTDAEAWRIVKTSDSSMMTSGLGATASFAFVGAYDTEYQLQFRNTDYIWSSTGCTFSFTAPVTPPEPPEPPPPLGPGETTECKTQQHGISSTAVSLTPQVEPSD